MNQFTIRRVESEKVERIESYIFHLSTDSSSFLRTEVVVRVFEGGRVASLSERSVDFGVFGREVRFVKVVDVGHVRSVNSCT